MLFHAWLWFQDDAAAYGSAMIEGAYWEEVSLQVRVPRMLGS